MSLKSVHVLAIVSAALTSLTAAPPAGAQVDDVSSVGGVNLTIGEKPGIDLNQEPSGMPTPLTPGLDPVLPIRPRMARTPGRLSFRRVPTYAEVPDLSSPRAALVSFANAYARWDYATAAACVDGAPVRSAYIEDLKRLASAAREGKRPGEVVTEMAVWDLHALSGDGTTIRVALTCGVARNWVSGPPGRLYWRQGQPHAETVQLRRDGAGAWRIVPRTGRSAEELLPPLQNRIGPLGWASTMLANPVLGMEELKRGEAGAKERQRQVERALQREDEDDAPYPAAVRVVTPGSSQVSLRAIAHLREAVRRNRMFPSGREERGRQGDGAP